MKRIRRLRKSTSIRETLAEVTISKDQLISPVFIVEKADWKQEIVSMPNIFQYSPDNAVDHITEMVDNGISNFILFGIPAQKDFNGEAAANPSGVVPQVLKMTRDQVGDKISLFADVCLCEYTTHGHCGIPSDDGEILNDPSLHQLAEAALVYAEAGADWIAPSNMMDGRVSSIRAKLDDNGYTNTAILSYSAKFASNYYGPFRDAAESPPQFGDRRSYQIDYRNPRQAMQELQTDEHQGADAVMVKPALAYLDVIHRARSQTHLPLFAYNVSGEYSMIKFGVQQGFFDEREIVLENLLAIRRAGADAILTYHTVDLVNNRWL